MVEVFIGAVSVILSVCTITAFINESVKKTIKSEFAHIDNKFQQIEYRFDKLESTVDGNELGRLGVLISNFSQDLRNGKVPSLNEYKTTYLSVNKYKSLGGNHFIEVEKELIDKSYKKHFGKGGTP